ncbi:MAG: methylenetetrahydrofolate reductase [NAD(P)H] [Nitrospinae bacterium RIFCSPLOWO2_12_FULL_47_7]|nr:MAG: methylenetetrahydrofolate reductase [NAD(P)H] [Nitrospinae bacterium RIFCSPLOWO2_12_FULL_47_7]
MKISEILQKQKPCCSFEFFPPKDNDGFDQLFETIENLKKWSPAFVSVTFGAGGSTRSKTVEIVGRIKNEIGLESMAHLTCVGSSADEVKSILDSLIVKKVSNILALRGDPPQDQKQFIKPENGFGFANELVTFIKKHYDFCLGVAGYPEGHIECPDKAIDLENLKRKVDAGADFIITQLFFDNNRYFDFVDRALAIGIKVPIIPGIMPIANVSQTKRFTKMCGASIPSALMERLEKNHENLPLVKEIGIEHATMQCEDLLSGGAPGIHFYTLNRSTATLRILESLKTTGRIV